jgi:hypothetical protein
MIGKLISKVATLSPPTVNRIDSRSDCLLILRALERRARSTILGGQVAQDCCQSEGHAREALVVERVGDYRLLTLAEMPPVEVLLVPSGGFWGGVGEAGGAAVAPAVANALFVASGERIRSLPLKKAGFDLS